MGLQYDSFTDCYQKTGQLCFVVPSYDKKFLMATSIAYSNVDSIICSNSDSVCTKYYGSCYWTLNYATNCYQYCPIQYSVHIIGKKLCVNKNVSYDYAYCKLFTGQDCKYTKSLGTCTKKHKISTSNLWLIIGCVAAGIAIIAIIVVVVVIIAWRRSIAKLTAKSFIENDKPDIDDAKFTNYIDTATRTQASDIMSLSAISDRKSSDFVPEVKDQKTLPTITCQNEENETNQEEMSSTMERLMQDTVSVANAGTITWDSNV